MANLDYNILGDDLEILEVQLAPGQSIKSEPGAMLYMHDHVDMKTNFGGSVFSGIKRKFAGEKLLVTSFHNNSNERAPIGLGSYYPGKIQAIDLHQYGGTFYCQKRAFLAAEDNVEVSISFVKKLGAGLFGGEGFILQKLLGEGLAFIHAGGTIIAKDLLPGEVLRVDTGCLLGFSKSIDYNITMINGVMNPLFAGEGFFLARMTGPGTVLMQSLPFSRLADNIGIALVAQAKKRRR